MGTNKLAGGRVRLHNYDARAVLDSYPTPGCATEALLQKQKLPGSVWEPACGGKEWCIAGGQYCHAWFVWDKSKAGRATRLRWLMPDTKVI